MTPSAVKENLPCPFCGGRCDPEGWGGCDEPGQPMKHGPACDDCGATAEDLETWNTRVPLKDGGASER